MRPECSPCIYLRAADGHFSHRRGEECVHQQRTHAVRHSLLTPPSSLLVRLAVPRWALQLCPRYPHNTFFCLELITHLILCIIQDTSYHTTWHTGTNYSRQPSSLK